MKIELQNLYEFGMNWGTYDKIYFILPNKRLFLKNLLFHTRKSWVKYHKRINYSTGFILAGSILVVLILAKWEFFKNL